MPRGISEIPELRLNVLQKFITTFMAAPDLMLMNMFSSSVSPSSRIRWESMRGGRGMSPFVAPGAVAPRTAPHGVAQHSAEAAYWKEKMYFDEEFLNNLRKEGTDAMYLDAKARLARELAGLVNRSNRRKEWMFAQMLFTGSFTYMKKGGLMETVDYDIPSDHTVTLAGNYRWGESSSNIIGDMRDGKRKIKEDCGSKVDTCICNSTVLAKLADDTTIRQLLQKSYFGDGRLFASGGNTDFVEANANVIASLLDIPKIIIYDEMYEIKEWLTSAVTGGQTSWITVTDTSNMVAGEKLRFHDVSAGTYEDVRMVAVDKFNNKIQLAGAPAASYKAAQDCVTMRKYYVPDDKFVMMASRVDGEPIAEYKEAPFGLGRQYGIYTDRKEEWDPEGIFIRVQNKGIPVLYHRDAVYVIDTHTTTAESQTSTTTTTTSSSSSTTTTS